MQKYEYFVVERVGQSPDMQMGFINRKSCEGWRFLHVSFVGTLTYYFERKISIWKKIKSKVLTFQMTRNWDSSHM